MIRRFKLVGAVERKREHLFKKYRKNVNCYIFNLKIKIFLYKKWYHIRNKGHPLLI